MIFQLFRKMVVQLCTTYLYEYISHDYYVDNIIMLNLFYNRVQSTFCPFYVMFVTCCGEGGHQRPSGKPRVFYTREKSRYITDIILL